MQYQRIEKPVYKEFSVRSIEEREKIKQRYDDIESDLRKILDDLQNIKLATRALESHTFY